MLPGVLINGMLNNHKVVSCNTLILNNSYFHVSVLRFGAFLQDSETVATFAPANKMIVNANIYFYERD